MKTHDKTMTESTDREGRGLNKDKEELQNVQR